MQPVASPKGALWAAALVLAVQAGASSTAQPVPRLAELVRDYEREARPYYPFTASESGLHQYDRVLANSIGADYRKGLAEICSRYLAAVRQIDAATLGEPERLTRDIFEFNLDVCGERLRLPWHLLPIDQVGRSLPSDFPVIGSGRGIHPFKTRQNYEDFLGRVDGFVVWIDTAIANMRTGIERGITLPRDLVVKILPQLDAQIVADARTSLFWEPIRNMPPDFDDATRSALSEKYLTAIETQIVPAYRRLRVFMQDEYLPRSRSTFGIADLPDGRAMYAYSVRVGTTTSLTPEEIFKLGEREVNRVSAEMKRVQSEIAFRHDTPPPRYATAEELVAAYADLRASIEAKLPALFGRLPKAGFEIRAIEAFREQSMPTSYAASSPDGARPGVFYLNAADVRGGRGTAVSRSVFLHEAVPGHHLQIALQRENRQLPGFRRFGGYNAFAEGWALYAESLGTELGAYGNRHDQVEMLGAELYRAKRLVLDVGLHTKGWTRERAIAYFGGRRETAEREVERYMAWPGQALGYKIGQLTIVRLRKKAEKTLGKAFDLRAFHDALLEEGGMPLTVLEARMDRWVAARRATSPSR
jgi:uncharacterized protein (DUF885 family)